MVGSRLSRTEEKTARHRIAIGLIGSIALLIFFAVFGLKLLIGFSLLVDKIRGGTTPVDQSSQSVLLAPVLDTISDATNSATLTIGGTAQANDTVILYKNGTEYKKLPIPDTGVFRITDIPVDEGAVSFYAIITDQKNRTSERSNTVSTTVDRTPPKLVVDSPSDNTTINDGSHKVTVTGLTDNDDIRVTITGRIVVIKSDGSFTYHMPLNDGQNKLEIIATDPAGNTTTVTRMVTYQP